MMDGATISHSLWLRGTPLGAASVPEVQHSVAMSLAVTWAARAACSAACTSLAPAREAASTSFNENAPAGTSSPKHSTCSSDGCAAASCSHIAAAACLTTRVAVTTARACVSARMWRSSNSRYCTGTGDTTNPSRRQARYTTYCSTELMQLHDHDVVAPQPAAVQHDGHVRHFADKLCVCQPTRRTVGEQRAVGRVDHRLALRMARRNIAEVVVDRARAPPALGGVLGDAIRRGKNHGDARHFQRCSTSRLTNVA